MNSNIKIYDKSNIDTMKWPDTEDGIYAKKYLIPLIKNGPEKYIKNIKTKLMVLQIDNIVLPVTINSEDYNNSYVCSPYTHYISYAIEELWNVNNLFFRKILVIFLKIFGIFLKIGKINNVVIVNNWLLSTNLYPNLSKEQIAQITLFIKNRFKNHAILFRSVNNYTYPKLYRFLKESSYSNIPSRQIYFLDKKLIEGKVKNTLSKDKKLLKNNITKITNNDSIKIEDIKRIKSLYDMLYLKKYSFLNPQFTEDFIELALRENLFFINAFYSNENLDAVYGYFIRDKVMTTPIFGYDTNYLLSKGLYRILSFKLIQDSISKNLTLNQSSGAASFKLNRGAKSSIEYTMVYSKHLKISRHIVWNILHFFSNVVAVPILKFYKL